MRLAVHQPEHIPWLGFFDKLNSVDVFILLDHVAFSKNNRQNRNQIISMHGKPHWLTIPVVASSLGHKRFNKVEIVDPSLWSHRYFETLRHSYEKYPFYNEMEMLLRPVKDLDRAFLAELNTLLILEIVNFLGLETRVLKSSDLHVAGSKTSLLVNLCKEVGASEYISGSGGMNYLSRDMFLAEGIDLKVRDFSRHTLDLLEHRGVSIIHHIATLGPSVIKHFDMSNSTESLL